VARIEELQDPAVRDPMLMAFQDKVEAVGDSAMAADAAEVTVTLKDGHSHTCRVDHCIGSATNPMTDAQLTRKFGELAEPVIGTARSRELADRSWSVERMGDVGELARAAG
jgi:2-methylcitrate dehydratase PrpD